MQLLGICSIFSIKEVSWLRACQYGKQKTTEFTEVGGSPDIRWPKQFPWCLWLDWPTGSSGFSQKLSSPLVLQTSCKYSS